MQASSHQLLIVSVGADLSFLNFTFLVPLPNAFTFTLPGLGDGWGLLGPIPDSILLKHFKRKYHSHFIRSCFPKDISGNWLTEDVWTKLRCSAVDFKEQYRNNWISQSDFFIARNKSEQVVFSSWQNELDSQWKLNTMQNARMAKGPYWMQRME